MWFYKGNYLDINDCLFLKIIKDGKNVNLLNTVYQTSEYITKPIGKEIGFLNAYALKGSTSVCEKKPIFILPVPQDKSE